MDQWLRSFGLFILLITIKAHPQNMQKYTENQTRNFRRQAIYDSQSTTDRVFRIGNEPFPVVFPQNNEDTSLVNMPLISVKRNPDGKLDATIKVNDRKSNMKLGANGNIVFPDKDNYETFTERPLNGAAPRCSKGGSFFCEKVDNYPIDQVVRVIQQESNKLEAAFGEDFLPEPLEISQRIDGGEESLCHSVERLIFPQAGVNKDNTWSFIINHENYTQGVRVEECRNHGKPCSMTESFPNGYTTECKQKYIYRQMLGYSPEGKVIKELYRLPSCCKCILKTN